MPATPPKKKIIIKVKPHTVHVGGEKPKPGNGGKGVETPVEPATLKLKKPGFLSKCLSVVKEDIHNLRFKTDAVVKEKDPGWEEYLRFLEMTKKK